MRPIQGWTETPKPDYRHRSTRDMPRLARVAQLVEQRIENPRVGGSNPSPGTISPFATIRQSLYKWRKSVINDAELAVIVRPRLPATG